LDADLRNNNIELQTQLDEAYAVEGCRARGNCGLGVAKEYQTQLEEQTAITTKITDTGAGVMLDVFSTQTCPVIHATVEEMIKPRSIHIYSP
jgi:hypothetical protein